MQITSFTKCRLTHKFEAIIVLTIKRVPIFEPPVKMMHALKMMCI
jgi:hypothetical protein